ncbi:MAG: lipocalin family protein [Bacteroidales bacterium]|nr:lipocalin family protein [Bacteroidales bacterium]
MNKLFTYLLGGLSFLGLGACSTTSNTPLNTSTVPALDIERYMGHWYEIARFDHPFEHGLEGCTADYELQEDGTVLVTNSGYKGSLEGKFKQSVGKARRPNAKVPGQLEVSFFMNFYSPYNVMELSPDYNYVLVGSKNDKYLWILSRTPVMEQQDLDYLLMRAKLRGYEIDNLIWVRH